MSGGLRPAPAAPVSSIAMPFPQTRLRRLRATHALRGLVRETQLDRPTSSIRCSSPTAIDRREPIAAMPGVDHLSIAHAVDEAGEAAQLGIPAVLLFGLPGRQGRGGLRRVGRRGHRPAGHARDQGGAPRPARDHRPVPVRVHQPRPLRRRADRRHRRQRRDARAARRGRRSPRPGPAPTSSPRAT